MKFFAWLREVLSDPADDQGSTQRLCLFLITLCLCVLLLFAGYGMIFMEYEVDVPAELSSLIKFTMTTLVGGIAWAKGVAGTVEVKKKDKEVAE